MQERWQLCFEKIQQIGTEPGLPGAWGSYFQQVASFLLLLGGQVQIEQAETNCEDADAAGLAAANCDTGVACDVAVDADPWTALLTQSNTPIWDECIVLQLYNGVSEAKYGDSFANPDVAVAAFGEKIGRLMAFVFAECYTLPPLAARGEWESVVIRYELVIQLYCIVRDLYAEYRIIGAVDDTRMATMTADATMPGQAADGVMGEKITISASKFNDKLYDALQEACYFFVFDYMDEETQQRTADKVDPSRDFAYRLIMDSDLSTYDYLYRYGFPIGPNQLKMREHLASMPTETLQKMADTYTEGYRIGFVKGNKDLSIKEVVQIVYPVGFEPVIKLAIANFEAMGLRPSFVPTSTSIFHKRGFGINGYYAESANKQFEYDHKEDEALFLDKKLLTRKLEVLEEAYVAYRDLSKKHAGPAWTEIFGEKDFMPKEKDTAPSYTPAQQKLAVNYAGKSGEIINTYVPGEERSFTIIAYPVAEIGPDYPAIFDETIALNTLPSDVYEAVQQTIIDALDTCIYARIEGMGGNRTDLTVQLFPLKDPEKETKFENCVADVNIPVGEVFTSPVLAGTTGTLHVSQVFLHELQFIDLELTFQDGFVKSYSCANYDSDEQNQKYVKDHVLARYDSLPMGEFAIGTNTTAYVMGRKYGIEKKLPILIAEKTGPHFAVGDTCYSHAEDVPVYNPDGKEIVARDNAQSLLRKDTEKKEEAYYQTHTDITIPYDELGRLYGVQADGTEVEIIREGRFVLPGTELLNTPLDCHH